MSTVVTYNGVTLRNVVTREWDEQLVFDPSDTDPIGKRYVLSFEAFIHREAADSQSTTFVGDGSQFGNATSALVGLRSKLMQERKSLTVSFGGHVAVSAEPFRARIDGQSTDVNNGPKPRSFRIVHVASDRLYRIRWTIEAVVLDCPQRSFANSDVTLSNRWNTRELMDENFRRIRVSQGQLRLAGSARRDNDCFAHAFRRLCFPPLEDGFARRSVIFQEEKCGNALNWEVVDHQTYYAPPYPATQIRGRHSGSTIDGYRFIQQCQVALTGPPHCDVRALLERAMQVCIYRLNWEQFQPTGLRATQRIIDATIQEDIGEVANIQVSIRTEEIGEDGRLAMTKIRNRRLGMLELPPLTMINDSGHEEDIAGSEYRITKCPIPSLYGYESRGGPASSLSIAFLRCVVQSKCSGAASPTLSTSAADSGEGYERERYETEVYQGYDSDELSDPDAGETWDDDHLSFMYMRVAAASEYIQDVPHVRLPIASSSGGGPTCTICQLSEGLAARVMTVDFERLGAWPQIPPWQNFSLGDVQFTRVGFDLRLLPVRPSEDATQLIYRAAPEYVHYADRPLPSNQVVSIVRLPVLSEQFAEDSVDLVDVINPSLQA